jgi:hypothetical protein
MLGNYQVAAELVASLVVLGSTELVGSLYVNRRLGVTYNLFSSAEISDHTQITRRYIPEDGNIHSYNSQNLISYNYILFLTVFVPHYQN